MAVHPIRIYLPGATAPILCIECVAHQEVRTQWSDGTLAGDMIPREYVVGVDAYVEIILYPGREEIRVNRATLTQSADSDGPCFLISQRR